MLLFSVQRPLGTQRQCYMHEYLSAHTVQHHTHACMCDRYTSCMPMSTQNPCLCASRVTIGSRVLFGPNVQLYAATHPLDGHVRQGIRGPEYAKPISIGDDVWVGGAVVVCPGVTIGQNSVVGAGSVVTKDVEPYTVVAGNPAKVIRRLERHEEQQQQQQEGAMLN